MRNPNAETGEDYPLRHQTIVRGELSPTERLVEMKTVPRLGAAEPMG